MSDFSYNGLGLLSRRGVLGMGAALGASVFVGASARAADPAAKGQVIIGFSQEPTNFHPLMLAIEVDQGVHWSLFNPLWGVDLKGNFIPQLAAEVPTFENGGISADGLDWKIRVRPGITWHDGAPFIAEDVKFTLELLQNPNFRAARRAGHELLRDIKVVSPTEIHWHMEKIYAPYVAILAWTF